MAETLAAYRQVHDPTRKSLPMTAVAAILGITQRAAWWRLNRLRFLGLLENAP